MAILLFSTRGGGDQGGLLVLNFNASSISFVSTKRCNQSLLSSWGGRWFW